MKLAGEKIYLRLLEEADAQDMTDLHLRNRDFFKNFITTKSEEFYTYEVQLARIKDAIERSKQDAGYNFGVFLNDSDTLIGSIGLSEILRGALQSCYVGYYLEREENGKGYMSEAVRLLVDYAFKELGLHRLEAGVMPHNIGSIRVLEKAGFRKEGIARKNVQINGVWQDHQVLAIIYEGWQE